MLAKAADALPAGDGWQFEPKWDGFRCIVFRDGDEIELGSRNERPLTRYFPELAASLLEILPARCVVDGEIVVATADGLDFDALQQRIHPAASRVEKLARETPASFVAFDLLALDDDDLTERPLAERRAHLETALADADENAPVHLTPATPDHATAEDWFVRFEGAGLDGVMAKDLEGLYVPDKRTQIKVKHKRTADCVVAGYRTHKSGDGVGSLLIGLYDDVGALHHMGVATSFTAVRRAELVDVVAPYERDALDDHPWRSWGGAGAEAARMPGSPSRWNAKKDLSWTALRLEMVAEVAYEHVQSGRFRHATRLVRFRPDREPSTCTFAQLEQVAPYELHKIFGV